MRFIGYLMTAAGFALLVGFVVWIALGRRGQPWILLLAGVVGIGFVFWRNREVRNWLRNHIFGLIGELRVARRLERLGPEYRVLHDRQRDHAGNVDHVVIGPAGAFAIETKAWRGRFSLGERGRLMVNGQPATEIVRQATHEAMWVKAQLRAAGIDTWVEALVVLTHTHLPEGPIRLSHVSVVTLADLLDEILARKARLTPDEVVRAANAVLRAGAPVEVRSVMGSE